MKRLWEVLGPDGEGPRTRTYGFALQPDEAAAVAMFEGSTHAQEITARPALLDEVRFWKAHEIEAPPLDIAMGYGALIPPDPNRPTWVHSEIEGAWLVHGPVDAPYGVSIDAQMDDEMDDE